MILKIVNLASPFITDPPESVQDIVRLNIAVSDTSIVTAPPGGDFMVDDDWDGETLQKDYATDGTDPNGFGKIIDATKCRCDFLALVGDSAFPMAVEVFAVSKSSVRVRGDVPLAKGSYRLIVSGKL